MINLEELKLFGPLVTSHAAIGAIVASLLLEHNGEAKEFDLGQRVQANRDGDLTTNGKSLRRAGVSQTEDGHRAKK